MDADYKPFKYNTTYSIKNDVVTPCVKPDPPPQTFVPPVIRSSDWLDALAEKWERTLAGWNAEHLQDCEYHKGYARAIKDILKELRADKESASN